MDMNEKLYSIYSEANIAVSKLTDEHNNKQSDANKKTAWPLFIKSNNSYELADIKLLVFGQETGGWPAGGNPPPYSSEITIEDVLKKYDEFFNLKKCYQWEDYKGFWTGIEKFIEKLRNKLSELNNEIKIDYLWNNIVKMGCYNNGKGYQRFPFAFYEKIVKPYLNKIISYEINILKPDYIIFFSGPNPLPGYENSKGGRYDDILDDIFGSPKRKYIDGFDERKLCEIIIPNVKKSFRTYHPRHLYSLKKNKDGKDIDIYFNKIINSIIQDIKKMYGA
jgi:hypothetical protein